MRNRRSSTAAAAASIAMLIAGCGDPTAGGRTPPQPAAVAADVPAVPADAADAPPAAAWFTEVTEAAGLHAVHDAGVEGEYRFEEIASPGAAWLDFDGDGRQDIYLVNGGTAHRSPSGRSVSDRLYRQRPDGTFEDVTEAAGLHANGYGVGCAVGDYDNDGDPDIYVANYGPDQLWRNNGDGTLTDVTAHAGIDNDLWSSSASFFDYDRDGLLDLFVVNYVLDPNAARCFDASGQPEYCGPASFLGSPDKLYRNTGDGRFADVSGAAGIAAGQGPGLGVVCTDLDDDGWPDVYVANDGAANFLWRNRGDGTFEESALLLGCAYNREGAAEAGMGIAVGDVDADGRTDLVVTHLVNETNTLYRGAAYGTFIDATDRSGLGMSSMGYTGFGVGLVDLDHDADLDLLVANGAVKRRSHESPGVTSNDYWRLYAEPNLLYFNDGRGRFTDVSDQAGPICTRAEVSRGLAFADFDGDGDLDVLMTQDDGPARLFRNDVPKQGHWLIVRARDGSLNRDALGAVVTVEAGGRTQSRPVIAGGSYASSSQPIAHFGLGGAEKIDRVTIRWPDGHTTRHDAVPIDASITLSRPAGAGTPGARP